MKRPQSALAFALLVAGATAVARATTPTAAHAVAPAAHWIAFSTTATAITGDITLSRTRITVARNVTFGLTVAGVADRFGTDAGTERARIYAVARPSNPVLRNGNRLCSSPVRWFVVWQSSPNDLGIAAFSDEAKPASEQSPGLCGTFGYTRH